MIKKVARRGADCCGISQQVKRDRSCGRHGSAGSGTAVLLQRAALPPFLPACLHPSLPAFLPPCLPPSLPSCLPTRLPGEGEQSCSRPKCFRGGLAAVSALKSPPSFLIAIAHLGLGSAPPRSSSTKIGPWPKSFPIPHLRLSIPQPP